VAVADRPGSDELLLASNENKIATDWSRDGRFILYRNFSATNGYDVWALPVDANGRKNGEPINVVGTAADERDAQFSPDVKWVAFQSNESGAMEIYVQPFSGGGAKYQVSKGGGAQVRWNPNGRELFYVGMDARLISVPMKLNPDGQHLEVGMPAPVLLTTLRGGELQTPNRQQYAVSSDGQRFLMRNVTPQPSTMPLTLILNWKPSSK
jgi:Tol biopolymer transport system component